MKKIALIIVPFIFLSCTEEKKKTNKDETKNTQMVGTWKLLEGRVVEKGDTTITDYTKDKSFIKIINDSHFSFLMHDLKGGKDSTALFTAGGGRYSLNGNNYTEHLEYCSAREWEGHDFQFTITFRNDTLIQTGVEKIESSGIDRLNTERYVRIQE